MGKYKDLALNTIFVFIGGGLSKIIGFIMLPFYTKWLTVEEFGESDLISVYSSLFLGLFTFCVAEGIFVLPKNETLIRQKKFFTSGILFTSSLLLFAGILYLIVGDILYSMGANPFIVSHRWYIYLFIVVTFIQAYTQQFARAINSIKVYSFTGVVQSISIALLGFLLIPNHGFEGYIFSWILASVVSIIYTVFFFRSYLYFSFRYIDNSIYKEILRYTVPLIPNSLMFWLVNALNRPMIESWVGLASVGILAVANKFPSIISMVFELFSKSWQISMLDEYGKDGFEQFFNSIFKSIIILLNIIGVLLAAFSSIIIDIFAAPEYYIASYYVPLLGLGVVFTCISYFIGAIFSAVKQSKYFFYSSLIGAFVSVILNFLLIPTLGLIGAVLASVLSFVSIAVSRYFYSRQFVRITNIWNYIILFSLYIIVIYICMQTNNFILRILLVLLYISGLVLINYSSILLLIKRLKK